MDILEGRKEEEDILYRRYYTCGLGWVAKEADKNKQSGRKTNRQSDR